MSPDDTSLDSIQDTDEDILDPTAANYGEDSIFSGGDPDEATVAEEASEEE